MSMSIGEGIVSRINLIRYMLACFLVISGLSTAIAQDRDATYAKTIADFKKSEAGRYFFNNAYGYAVFPKIGKIGVVIGGAHGKGRVYRMGKWIGNASVTQLSLGLQLGGQAYSQVVFMQDQRAFEDFTSGNFELGAEFNAIAVNARVGAQAGTTGASASSGLHPSETEQVDTGYYRGLAVLTSGIGGLMYEASVAGQKYKFTPKK